MSQGKHVELSASQRNRLREGYREGRPVLWLAKLHGVSSLRVLEECADIPRVKPPPRKPGQFAGRLL